MEQKLPEIFNYLDFRSYLSDYQRARYQSDKEFSRVNICRKLGLPNSRSYFTDIINGKKLSVSFLERFLEILDLSVDEARYFRLLVSYNQADTADEQEYFFEQLLTHHNRTSTILEHDSLIYYKDWYHSAVRAVLDVFDFKDEFSAIADAVYPPVTARQAKESVNLLLRLGLIKKNEHGFYKPQQGTISTGMNSKDDLIRRYQIQMLQCARDVLAKKSDGDRSITTKVLSLSTKGYERLERRLQNFMLEISAIVKHDSDPADRVYHLDIQLFPGSARKEFQK